MDYVFPVFAYINLNVCTSGVYSDYPATRKYIENAHDQFCSPPKDENHCSWTEDFHRKNGDRDETVKQQSRLDITYSPRARTKNQKRNPHYAMKVCLIMEGY